MTLLEAAIEIGGWLLVVGFFAAVTWLYYLPGQLRRRWLRRRLFLTGPLRYSVKGEART